MEQTKNCILFVKKGFLCTKRELIYPTDMSWADDVWVEVGPVLLKLYATQFTIFSEHPKLSWDRNVFADILSNPKTTALSFLSSASNVSFASTNAWEVEMYSFEHKLHNHTFHPVSTFNFKFKEKGIKSVSIAYRKI